MENLNNEIWRDIPNYEGYYQVSNLGRIMSLHSGKKRILSQPITKHGYYSIMLRVKCKWKSFLSHQLVAICFLNHQPCGVRKVVNHKDGNKLNNNLSNLEIVSQRENTSTCFRSNKHTFSSKYCGVTFDKRHKTWSAKILIKNKNFHLGTYKNEIEASEAYQKAVKNIDDSSYFDSIKRKKSSKYKGVSYHKREQKWKSFCMVDKKLKSIGTFKTEEEAYNSLQTFLKAKV